VNAPPSTAARSALREQLTDRFGFDAPDNRLRPPPARPGLLRRAELTSRLTATEGVVVVTAPAGYGKTSLLSDWVRTDPRPTVWMSLDAADNDPVVQLTGLALALDAVEPIDPAVLWPLLTAAPSVPTVALPRFGRMLASRRTPIVLVLDDIHELVSREALDALGVVITELPPGSTVALSGRAMPALPLGRLRVKRGLLEVAMNDLALDVDDAVRLYRSLEMDLPLDDVRLLVERTEGWPTGLYLAALSLRNQADPHRAVVEFRGDHRLVVDYLMDELMAGLDPDVASFLLDGSCLQRLSGPLCDAVLDRSGSAVLLEDLARQNLLVLPLDQRGHWYRFHRLLHDMLEAELVRRDARRAVRLHRLASEWFEANADADLAIHHATRAGDTARAEGLVVGSYSSYAASGRHATIERWLGLFTEEQLSTTPFLVALATYSRIPAADGPGALHWLARAELTIGDADPDEPGMTPAALVAMLRSLIRPQPAQDMLDDALHGYRRFPPGDWHANACMLVGAAEMMLGDDERALAVLQEAAAEATASSTHAILVMSLALMAMLEVERGRWDEATMLGRRARQVLREHDLDVVPSLFLVTAVSSLVEARAGRTKEAEADHVISCRHLTGYLQIAPWANLEARVALARADLLLGDRVGARTLLDEADRFLFQVPDAAYAKEQLAAVRRMLDERPEGDGWGPSSLTTAELRVLRYLTTHLTMAEIAERLYVSRNTVKTQAIAIYRKLGTASRSGAVEVAREAGLLDDVFQGA
jgi:LuxR family maltose regulon positive regulatory protein